MRQSTPIKYENSDVGHHDNMRLQFFDKIGGVLSTVGVALFVAFAAVLLVYPVSKECDGGTVHCRYISSAPQILQPIVTPAYLAISLMTISCGILVIRLSRRVSSKKVPSGS